MLLDTGLKKTSQIGILNEHSLHADLKRWLQQPDDLFEVPLGRYVVDILRGEQVLEVQTSQLKRLQTKLIDLTTNRAVTVVYPLLGKCWLYRPTLLHKPQRRLSPKHENWLSLFTELVYCPNLLNLPNLTVQLVLVEAEQHLTRNPERGWRKKAWLVQDTRLVTVLETRCLCCATDWWQFLPNTLPESFSSVHLAANLNCSTPLAGKILYTFWRAGWLERQGKAQRAWLYRRVARVDTQASYPAKSLSAAQI
jgi:hypothetical protein